MLWHYKIFDELFDNCQYQFDMNSKAENIDKLPTPGNPA